MIDTISITIEEKNFEILDHNRFSINTKHLFEAPFFKVTGKSPFQANNNPKKIDKEEFGYLPRITIFKALRRNGFEIFLKVEFSIPKLLYGNNFDEIEDFDFGEICWKLKEGMKHMGVLIKDVNLLAYAKVSKIHYSKNIILTDYTTPYTFMEEIRKINVNKHFDMNQSDFRNEGHSIKYRSNGFEVIFYDKLKDLERAKKSDSRSEENDNYTQLGLFDSLKLESPFEVLRMEIRINDRKKLKQIIKKYDLRIETLDFNTLFSKRVAKTILLSFMEEIENAYPVVLKDKSDSLKEFTANLIINNPNLNYSQILKYVGVKALIEENGIREFRAITNKFNNTNWYRLNKSMKSLNLNAPTDIFATIKKHLTDFKKVQLSEYKEKIKSIAIQSQIP